MFRYIAFYKPYGVLSQFTPDHPGQNTLADFLEIPKDIYPIGRLDKDSEGLLMLSNDASLNAQLLNPENQHPRTYLVQCERVPNQRALDELRDGVIIRVRKKDHACKPAEVRLLSNEPDVPPRHPPVRYRKTVPTSWLEITLREGKNRQVRRMCAAVGFPVLRLIRTKIGTISIGTMKPGEYQELNLSDIHTLLNKSQ